MSSLDPLTAAARLAGRRGRVLLHSGRDDDGCGAWSFAASDPVASLEIRGRVCIVRGPDGAIASRGEGDPFAAIEAFARAHGADLADRAHVEDAAPEPRVIGWLGYELGHAGARAAADADPPDAWLGAYDAVARWRPDGTGPE